jgi:hypothetical protein
MSKTKRLGLPYILQAQAQKEVTHNQALNMLDVYVNTVAEDIVDELPTTCTEGDIYIEKKGNLAQFSGGNWIIYQPTPWMEVWLKANKSKMIYTGEDWVEFVIKANNVENISEALQISEWQEDITLSGNQASSTKFLLDHSLVIAVNIWVVEPIVGVDNFSVGVKDDLARYGSNIGSAKDTTNVGMTNYPTTYYNNTQIIFTSNDGGFTGGVIRLSVQYFKPKGSWGW